MQTKSIFHASMHLAAAFLVLTLGSEVLGDRSCLSLGDDSESPHALASEATLNVPPPGFTALFNGKDFTGWRLSPKAKAYTPAKHQEYVDRRWPKLSPEQVARALQLWKVKQEIDPDMPNRGFSFVKILEYVAKGETPPAENRNKTPGSGMDVPVKSSVGATPEEKTAKPVNAWKWSAETNNDGANRKATPVKISAEQTIDVASFGVSDGDLPPVVLLPESRLSVSGRVATSHRVYFGFTITHPNGDFAGRFLTSRPADEFQGGKDFEVTLELQEFQLDPSLADLKDKLPSEPVHFVVESFWFTTLEKQAGLEIAEADLIPPSEANSLEPNGNDTRRK